MTSRYIPSLGEPGQQLDFNGLLHDGPLYDNPEYDEALSLTPAVPLPDGFYYADMAAFAAQEKADLENAIGMRRHMTAGDMAYESLLSHLAGKKLIGTGVRRASDNRLVGFGCLSFSDQDGLFCDLAVNPEEQHKGIGSTLIAERLRQARGLQLSQLVVKLSQTNNLEKRYVEHGFVVRKTSPWRSLYQDLSA